MMADLLFVVGLGLLFVGSFMVHTAAGIIVVGLTFIGAGLLLHQRSDPDDS